MFSECQIFVLKFMNKWNGYASFRSQRIFSDYCNELKRFSVHGKWGLKLRWDQSQIPFLFISHANMGNEVMRIFLLIKTLLERNEVIMQMISVEYLQKSISFNGVKLIRRLSFQANSPHDEKISSSSLRDKHNDKQNDKRNTKKPSH